MGLRDEARSVVLDWFATYDVSKRLHRESIKQQVELGLYAFQRRILGISTLNGRFDQQLHQAVVRLQGFFARPQAMATSARLRGIQNGES